MLYMVTVCWGWFCIAGAARALAVETVKVTEVLLTVGPPVAICTIQQCIHYDTVVLSLQPHPSLVSSSHGSSGTIIIIIIISNLHSPACLRVLPLKP